MERDSKISSTGLLVAIIVGPNKLKVLVSLNAPFSGHKVREDIEPFSNLAKIRSSQFARSNFLEAFLTSKPKAAL